MHGTRMLTWQEIRARYGREVRAVRGGGVLVAFWLSFPWMAPLEPRLISHVMWGGLQHPSQGQTVSGSEPAAIKRELAADVARPCHARRLRAMRGEWRDSFVVLHRIALRRDVRAMSASFRNVSSAAAWRVSQRLCRLCDDWFRHEGVPCAALKHSSVPRHA